MWLQYLEMQYKNEAEKLHPTAEKIVFFAVYFIVFLSIQKHFVLL